MFDRTLIGILLGGIPICYLAYQVKKVIAEERAKSRVPFTAKMLRPPGESLRLRIDDLVDKAADKTITCVGLIAAPVLFAILSPVKTTSAKFIVYVTIPALFWIFAVRVWLAMRKLRTDLRNARLGFDGERVVASELNQLLGLADPYHYHAFHDFVFDMKPGGERTTFNIDHIAIGQKGVFVIETKARRKGLKPSATGQENHKLVYDGAALKSPSGYRDEKPIQQAMLSAKELRAWIREVTGFEVPVTPIVVILGWYIDRKGRGDVHVLNENEAFDIKNDRAHNLDALGRGVLSEEQRTVITNAIREHCRNIDWED